MQFLKFRTYKLVLIECTYENKTILIFFNVYWSSNRRSPVFNLEKKNK